MSDEDAQKGSNVNTLGAGSENPGPQRSHSLTTSDKPPLNRELNCIAEDPDNPPALTAEATAAAAAAAASAASQNVNKDGKTLTPAQKKRATLVKKAIRYFEDKSNRSVSEDNLFTRRKNLAVHLGLDEKVSKKEIQKINTFSLPVPSSATSFDIPDPVAINSLILVDEEEDDTRSKDLVNFLGMKDGLTASIASQGTLSESPRSSLATKASPALSSGGKSSKDPLFKF